MCLARRKYAKLKSVPSLSFKVYFYTFKSIYLGEVKLQKFDFSSHFLRETGYKLLTEGPDDGNKVCLQGKVALNVPCLTLFTFS